LIRRMGWDVSHKIHLPKWAWYGLGALVAVQLYFVRELLAALVLFTIGFAVLGVIALGFYLVEKAGEWGFEWAEPRARILAPIVREQGARVIEKSAKLVEELSKKPFHRPHSETAR